MAGRHATSWSYSYDDLQKLTGKAPNSIYQAASRATRGVDSGFHPDDFKSVVLWVFRNASREFKMELIGEMGFFRETAEEKRRKKKLAEMS
jgi:hypothetical protein